MRFIIDFKAVSNFQSLKICGEKIPNTIYYLFLFLNLLAGTGSFLTLLKSNIT